MSAFDHHHSGTKPQGTGSSVSTLEGTGSLPRFLTTYSGTGTVPYDTSSWCMIWVWIALHSPHSRCPKSKESVCRSERSGTTGQGLVGNLKLTGIPTGQQGIRIIKIRDSRCAVLVPARVLCRDTERTLEIQCDISLSTEIAASARISLV